MALDAIFAHKMRSILTILGIVIGVSSVIVIVAIGQGGAAKLSKSFTGRSNSIIIIPSSEMLKKSGGVISPDFFTQEDIQELQHIDDVESVVIKYFETATVFYQKQNAEGIMVVGINSNDTLEEENIEVVRGRSFETSDYGGNCVALMSLEMEKQLFKERNGIEKIIRIKNQPIEVIGIVEKKDDSLMMNTAGVYMPDKAWTKVFGKSNISQLTLRIKKPDAIKRAGNKAIEILNKNHNTQGDYEVQNLEEIEKGIEVVTNTMTIVIGSIAGISLLVGGVGIMNIMLVSVTERTQEIGIRLALGATRSNILIQFLTEAITLSLLGGIVGLLIGTGVSNLINLFTPFPTLVSFPVAVGTLLFSVILGIVFGILPAEKASKLDPIQCLNRN
ncbi:MAG: ABC transporter permease [Thermoactinomyces sp.]